MAELYLLAAGFQSVRVLCPASGQEKLRDLLGAGSAAIELYDYETDDVWIRDFGPIFLMNDNTGELCIADWRYNAWGNKFSRQSRDDRASAWIADSIGLRRFVFDTVVEGGAVESNGSGMLLTTEAVLLNPNRNGKLSKAQMEMKLCSGFGVDQILWLKDGLAGDDTDGHIDNLARFFKPDGIVIAHSDNPGDHNFAALETNTACLRGFRPLPGKKPLASVQLPLPQVFGTDGEPLAASYLNYLVLNGAVLVPTYRQAETDNAAIEVLKDCFPGREVIGFDCADFIHEGGALHCMSQNQPSLE